MVIDIFSGCVGLALTFVVLIAVMLLILIKANNVSFKLKVILIPLVIWYSTILYNVPYSFLGWPNDRLPSQHEVLVLGATVNQDKSIFIWVVDHNLKNAMSLDPRMAGSLNIDGVPRAYVIPYNSELHHEIIKLQELIRQQGKGVIKVDINKLRGFKVLVGEEPTFEVFDPAKELLLKNENEAEDNQH